MTAESPGVGWLCTTLGFNALQAAQAFAAKYLPELGQVVRSRSSSGPGFVFTTEEGVSDYVAVREPGGWRIKLRRNC